MIYLQLFFEFFKTGLFATGGGMATIPFLSAMTDKYDWFTKAQLADMIAVAESTPGPIGVNTATYAGFRAAGVPGALTATFALVLPSFLVVLLVSRALNKYQENPLVQGAFRGLRPAATGLIAGAFWSVLTVALGDAEGIFGLVSLPALLLFILLFALTNAPRLKKLHPVAFVGLAALAGVALGL